MEGLKSAKMVSKEVKSLPKGAKITRKREDISIEEIENGYILSKSCDIDYTLNGENKYFYHTKKYFMKDNPLEDALEGLSEKSLADNFS